MGTDPALTAIVFHRGGEVDWEKTTVKNRFVSYDFSTGEVYGLSEQSVQKRTRVMTVERVPTAVELTAVTVIIRSGVLHADSASVWKE